MHDRLHVMKHGAYRQHACLETLHVLGALLNHSLQCDLAWAWFAGFCGLHAHHTTQPRVCACPCCHLQFEALHECMEANKKVFDELLEEMKQEQEASKAAAAAAEAASGGEGGAQAAAAGGSAANVSSEAEELADAAAIAEAAVTVSGEGSAPSS